MKERKHEVVLVRSKHNFYEEYNEGTYKSIKQAKDLANELAGRLTPLERKYNTVEVRTNFNEYDYEVVYQTNGDKGGYL